MTAVPFRTHAQEIKRQKLPSFHQAKEFQLKEFSSEEAAQQSSQHLPCPMAGQDLVGRTEEGTSTLRRRKINTFTTDQTNKYPKNPSSDWAAHTQELQIYQVKDKMAPAGLKMWHPGTCRRSWVPWCTSQVLGSCLHLWGWMLHGHPKWSALQPFPSWNWGMCVWSSFQSSTSLGDSAVPVTPCEHCTKWAPHQLKTKPFFYSTRATSAWKDSKLNNKGLFNTWQEFPGGSGGILCLETTNSSSSTQWKAAQPRHELRHRSIISLYPQSFQSLQEASKLNVIRKTTSKSIPPFKPSLHRWRVFPPKEYPK